jgi:hypothetical protein
MASGAELTLEDVQLRYDEFLSKMVKIHGETHYRQKQK